MKTTTRFALALFSCAAFLAASDIRQQTSYAIDPAQTKVEFTLGSTLHTIHGTFRLTRGDLRFDPTTGKASGELAVDAGSGESGSGARDRRMQNSILETPRFPEIVFRPDRVEGRIAEKGRSQVLLHGRFLLHGEEHEFSLPLLVDTAGGRYEASATFIIPYVKWGMKNPSTLFLRVNDKVEITVRTVAHIES